MFFMRSSCTPTWKAPPMQVITDHEHTPTYHSQFRMAYASSTCTEYVCNMLYRYNVYPGSDREGITVALFILTSVKRFAGYVMTAHQTFCACRNTEGECTTRVAFQPDLHHL